MKTIAMAIALIMMLSAPAQAVEGESTILPAEWSSYKESFVTEDGRVVDTANNGISHSESQGYGLILAVLAGRPAGFRAHLELHPHAIAGARRWTGQLAMGPRRDAKSDRHQ
jgi:endo-1,4-beta-D-glucanase Y